MKKKTQNSPYLWLAPSLILLVAITVIPTLFLYYTSLVRWELGMPWSDRTFVGLSNYAKIFKDFLFRQAILRTLVYTVVSVGLQFFLGFLIAQFMSRKTLRWKGILIAALIIPMTVTPSIAGLIWRLYFNPNYGIINYFLRFLGIAPDWYSYSLALTSVIIVDVWQWTPFVALVLFAGISALPPTPFEAAVVDGATKFQMLRFITLPLLKPIILIVLLLRSMDALKMFDVVFSLTGGGPADATELLSMLVYRTGFYQTGMVGLASAMAVILLLIIILLSQAFIKILGEKKVEF
ncbi:MAG: carbohydrate ABC transporter permease [Bacillota bacterium]